MELSAVETAGEPLLLGEGGAIVAVEEPAVMEGRAF
jgi:hypothetical protein